MDVKIVCLLIILLFANAISWTPPSICKNIITRDGWGARPSLQIQYAIKPVPLVVIHHTVTPECNTESACKSRIFNIQSYHMENVGFDDIAYNFLIGSDGNAYEGIGWHKIGAHTSGFNTKSVGIGFIGTFTDKYPTSAAVRATKDLLECGVQLGELEPNYKLVAARQVSSTESPGLRLFSEIKTWPNWSSHP